MIVFLTWQKLLGRVFLDLSDERNQNKPFYWNKYAHSITGYDKAKPILFDLGYVEQKGTKVTITESGLELAKVFAKHCLPPSDIIPLSNTLVKHSKPLDETPITAPPAISPTEMKIEPERPQIQPEKKKIIKPIEPDILNEPILDMDGNEITAEMAEAFLNSKDENFFRDI